MPRRDLTWIPRLLGAATAAYGAAVAVKPDVLLAPAKLAGEGRPAPAGAATLARAVGGRDLASGLAMALAPAGTPLKAAIAVRVGADVVDLAVLGSQLPDRDAREKATLVAAAWGALCALSLLAADPPRRGRTGRA
ncbi:hypothetical protein [Pseudonocardia spirodelae]|uniref:DUF4267 domain-containing protein n=1 Tax=Pseudonocardia spirodelae TaxID=3133431 RepID=A0ABU8T7Y5_9PSEU